MHATACFNALLHKADDLPNFYAISWRKRRGSVTRERYGEGYITITVAAEVAHVGRSGRAALSEKRTAIDPATRERIRDLDRAGWSLRSIAGDVGVSHESVRVILRETVVPAVN